jgi:8-oxo-dGTP diphosphatase
MTSNSTRRYRISRFVGRFVTRTAATLTLGHMPPFVSTSALVRDGDHLLVVIDPIRDEPILPGGHLQWRERPEDAVIREVREETGLEIRPEKLVAVLAGREWAGEDGIVRVLYSAVVVGGRLTSSGEGQALWIPIQGAVASMSRDGSIVDGWLNRRNDLPRAQAL